VHPGAAFDVLTYADFVAAARVSAPVLARSAELGVGQAILQAVEATIAQAGTNVNLGICLLLAPLAAVPLDQPIRSGIHAVLSGLTVEDARLVYEAIRLANPGGLGDAPQQDVREAPTQNLLDVMKLAAERDGIASEYARNFLLTTLVGTTWLKSFVHEFHQLSSIPAASPAAVDYTDWELATIHCQLSLMKVHSDTLIRRKCGDATYHEAACRAEFLLDSGGISSPNFSRSLSEFDAWLRADGHQRNPGTTADLIAAAWFIAIRDKAVVPPTKAEVLAHAARIQNGV
jgi:triphosphoribosyl-dephospho-CoA synthase